MIDFIKQTPSAYHESRDFQLICKLYDALLDACKFYSDSIKDSKTGKIKSMGTLKSLTVNFRPRHAWDEDILESISNNFKQLMFYKGTVFSISAAINILLRLYDIPTNHKIIITTKDEFDYVNSSESASGDIHKVEDLISTNYLYILIPRDLAAIGIVQDLLDYLLPVGVFYRIIETDIIDKTFEDFIFTNWVSDDLNKKPLEFIDRAFILPKTGPSSSNNDILGETYTEYGKPIPPEDIHKPYHQENINLPIGQIYYNKVVLNDDDKPENQ